MYRNILFSKFLLFQSRSSTTIKMKHASRYQYASFFFLISVKTMLKIKRKCVNLKNTDDINFRVIIIIKKKILSFVIV